MRQGAALDEIETRQHHKSPKKWERKDKALEEKIKFHEDFWDSFVLLAKVCVLHDPNSTIYDVFDTWRTKLLGGWEFSDELIEKIDAQIEEEERARLATDSNGSQ